MQDAPHDENGADTEVDAPVGSDTKRTVPIDTAALEDFVSSGVGEVTGGKLGKYQLERQLGTGAMGTVWASHHPDLGIPVAVKTLHKGLMSMSPQFVERFNREAKTAAMINHPNVVRVYDSGEDEGTYYIVMEYVGGGTAGDLVEAEGALSVEQARQIVLDAALGLEAAAAFGVVHRDIKPGNIMVGSDGESKLADLGLAKTIDSSDEVTLTMTGASFGSPGYMSPEQAIDSRRADARSDIYSLGATFYQLLTGALPYEAQSAYSVMQKHLHDPLPEPRQVRPELPLAYSQVIQRMMAKRPDDRYQTAAELVKALEKLPVPQAGDASKRQKNTMALVVTLVGMLALVVTISLMLIEGGTNEPEPIVKPTVKTSTQPGGGAILPPPSPTVGPGGNTGPEWTQRPNGTNSPLLPVTPIFENKPLLVLPACRPDLKGYLKVEGVNHRMLTWEEVIDPEILDTTVTNIVLMASGLGYRHTLEEAFDVDKALERYLRQGGVLILVGVETDEFYQSDVERGIGKSTIERLGLPIDFKALEKKNPDDLLIVWGEPVKRTMGLSSSLMDSDHKILSGTINNVPGDLAWNLAGVRENNELVGTLFMTIIHTQSEPKNGAVVYMWSGLPGILGQKQAFSHLFKSANKLYMDGSQQSLTHKRLRDGQ